MIDNPEQVTNLLEKLQAALPLPAIITPRLATALREQKPGMSIPRECQVTWVSYAGDEGGITCRLSTTPEADGEAAFFVSITHLDFDPRLPLAREIAVYQLRRVKRLRRQNRRLGRTGDWAEAAAFRTKHRLACSATGAADTAICVRALPRQPSAVWQSAPACVAEAACPATSHG